MVLGSGRQRDARGMEPAEASRLLQEGLALLAPRAHAAGSTVLIEALPARVTNVVNTLEQAAALVRAVAHPGLSGMFDFHNCEDETAPWADLLAEHRGMIRHVHLNDPQGGYPCLARLSRAHLEEYRSAFRVLSERAYDGWVSLEVFQFEDPPERALAETRRALERIAAPASDEASGA
jgi:D-psicose/D-tagatose/L-ribulose 3-epimerase